MNKSVLMSIQPYYVFLIIVRAMGWNISQEKEVEVRKKYPKDSAWNRRVHIYCSKNRKSFNQIPVQYQPFMEKLLGKVIGEFVCDRIKTFDYRLYAYSISIEELVGTQIGVEDLNEYGAGKTLYGIHIADLKIYDTPKELGEFFVKGECDCQICAGCKNFHKGMGWLDGSTCDEDDCIEYGIKPLTRAPQSWCYVEEI